MSSLIAQCYNIRVTKYCRVNGGHYMHYLWKAGFHCMHIYCVKAIQAQIQQTQTRRALSS